MAELSTIRKEILSVIETNSRIDLKELAIITDSDEITVANEIAQMEKEHIICGYHTMINWEKTTNEKVSAMIEVTVTPQRGVGFDKLADRIKNFEEVNAVYLISGGFDFMVLVDEKSMRAVSQFVSEKLSTMEEVRGTATHFVLKRYKVHGTILEDEKTDERMLVTP